MNDVQHTVIEHAQLDRQHFQKANGIIGNSLEMRELVDTVIQVAPSDITVLITGESGTGKEIIAKSIHSASTRSAKKFIAVNCGAIPEGILESELFGHEKGSFTGAIETRKGYFEIADGGTLFLDEIGDTPVATQVKLLRVLETGEFMRVGASEQRHADVRVIAATNKNLDEEVAARRFRQDLFYRLRSVNIRIPPLRQRRADIPLLVDAFLQEVKRRDPSSTIMLTEDAMAALMRHSWPGNVRELRNLIESLTVLEHGRVVDENTLARYLHPSVPVDGDRPLPVWLGKSSEQAERELIFRALIELRSEVMDLRRTVEKLVPRAPAQLPPPLASNQSASQQEGQGELSSFDDMPLDEIEKVVIQRTLERFEGNRRLAARLLNISERTLYRKIRDYGL